MWAEVEASRHVFDEVFENLLLLVAADAIEEL